MKLHRNFILVFFLFLAFSCKISNNRPNRNNNEMDLNTGFESNAIFDENNNEPLKKSLLIMNFDINKIAVLIKEICIRWNMLENIEYKIYLNQKLFFYLKYDELTIEESNQLRYIVVYDLNNSTIIEIQDYMKIKSKWFDNFTIDIINILENNEINYEEI